MAVPQVLRKQMDKAGDLLDLALAARAATEKAVDVADAQVGDIFGWRHNPIFDVLIRVEAGGGEVVAELKGLVALFERNGERKALPVLRIPIVPMFVG